MSDSSLEVRVLGADDAEALCALRRQALSESPLAFAASPEDDFLGSPGAVRARLDDAAELPMFGAFAGQLVGMLAMYRERRLKTRHKVSLLAIYVHPNFRGLGLGGRLIEAALAHAESVPGLTTARLTVSETAPGARRLYERMGFEAWGVEPDALRHQGRTEREFHMALALPRGSRA